MQDLTGKFVPCWELSSDRTVTTELALATTWSAHVRLCEDFQMTAHRDGLHQGRRPKASKEGTRWRWVADGEARAMAIDPSEDFFTASELV
jgi:hypothetical protein